MFSRKFILISVLALVSAFPACGEPEPIRITVDGKQRDQYWEGFGACASTFDGIESWAGPSARLPHSMRPNAPLPRELRRAALEEVLVDLRLNIHYAGALIEPINDNNDPTHFDFSQFHFGGFDFGNNRRYSGMDQFIDDYILNGSRTIPGALEPRFHFTLYMNGRCAPDWMERFPGTDVFESIDKGLDPSLVAEVAEHLHAMVLRFKERTGTELELIGLFNEPGGKDNVGGTILHATTLVLGRRLAAAGLKTQVVVADAMLSEGHAGTIDAILDDAEASQYVGAVSYHRYVEAERLFENIHVCRKAVAAGKMLITKPVSYVPRAHRAGKGVRLTETMFYQPDDTGEHGRLRTVCLMDEINIGRATACYGIGSTIYTPEDYESPTRGRTGPAAIPRPDPKTKLFTGVDSSHAWEWLGLLTRYIRPGAQRVESKSSDNLVRSLVFIDPARGQLFVYVLNNDHDTREVRTQITEVELRSMTNRIRTSNNMGGGLADIRRNLDPVPITSGQFTDQVPPFSLTLYEIEIPVTPTLRLIQPAETETWVSGRSETLRFAAEGCDEISWSLSFDGGKTTAHEGRVAATAGRVILPIPNVKDHTNSLLRLESIPKGAQLTREIAILTTPPAFELTRLTLNDLETGVGIPGDRGTLRTKGASGPVTEWKVISGEVPAGVHLDPVGGVFYGIPHGPGDFRVVVEARVAAPQSQSARAEVRFRISEPPLQLLTPNQIPSSAVGNFYRHPLRAKGGRPPYHFSLLAGELPPGLVLDPNGVLSGRPEKSGQWRVELGVRDTTDNRNPPHGSFDLKIDPQPLNAAGPWLKPRRIGETMEYPLEIQGGQPPYQVSVLGGELPPGLTITPGGVLQGTPKKTGTFVFSTTIRDSSGNQTHQGYSLTIEE